MLMISPFGNSRSRGPIKTAGEEVWFNGSTGIVLVNEAPGSKRRLSYCTQVAFLVSLRVRATADETTYRLSSAFVAEHPAKSDALLFYQAPNQAVTVQTDQRKYA
ncbi:hypothetical protein [Sphingomonas insulae]|uniref:Uncharacterized protein n=1 Tax=Sphingomonas insulae TaxID=424800 RepID=A0ABN1HZE2_9SPHN|nr:hypothetical protein [Sphingomonas insulae]